MTPKRKGPHCKRAARRAAMLADCTAHSAALPRLKLLYDLPLLLSSAVAQPLAALPPYGCGVPLAGNERPAGWQYLRHKFIGAMPSSLSLRGGQRPTWRPEREARGSALGVQSREGSYVFAGAFLLSNCVLRDCHVASLLAMTHQVVRRCTSALLPLNGSVQGAH